MIDHARLGYVEDGSSKRMAMSEIASYSSSYMSHSLRIVLHLWIPEPKHQILHSREGSMSECVAWGVGGMPVPA